MLMQMFVKQEPRVWSFRSLLLLPPFNRTFSLFMFVPTSTSQQGCRFVVAGGFFEKPGEGQGTGKVMPANSRASHSSELCSERHTLAEVYIHAFINFDTRWQLAVSYL